jgi:hypothetical protein
MDGGTLRISSYHIPILNLYSMKYYIYELVNAHILREVYELNLPKNINIYTS